MAGRGANVSMPGRTPLGVCEAANATARGSHNRFVSVRLSCGALPSLSASVGMHVHTRERAVGESHGKRRVARRFTPANGNLRSANAIQTAQPHGRVELRRPEGTPRPAAFSLSRP